jgi:ubiquinone/menaquinone biosynthesis C-methylase UbiE
MAEIKWLAYNELAWIETIVASPKEYAEETEHYCRLIKAHSRIPVKTLLHLGCGAGGNDHTLKKHFQVTGVDISEGMLAIARRRNPEVRYIKGDMRTVALKERFDAVAIPDSIGYMTTIGDLRKAIGTACRHLNPGGVFLIVALIKEDFRENNFVYAGSGKGAEVTIFENNHALKPRQTVYEAAVVYLVRRRGKLKVFTEIHTQGLFPLTTWISLLKSSGLTVNQSKREHAYDCFLRGDGKYALRLFTCLLNSNLFQIEKKSCVLIRS